MKRLYIYIYALIAIFVVVGCEENQMDAYANDPALYFSYSTETSTSQADSINYSFFVLPTAVKRDTVHVRVNTMGMPVGYDRPIKVVQTNVGESNAAVPGVHFVSLDDAGVRDSLRIPADSVGVYIPVIVLRDATLSTDVKRLELALVENEHFRLGIDAWRTFVVTISDVVTKPQNWTNWSYYFGASWGVNKMRFIIQITGYTEWGSMPDIAYCSWMSGMVKQALIDYNLANVGNELKETDGITPVSMWN